MPEFRWYSVIGLFLTFVIIYYSLYIIALPEVEDLIKLLVITGLILGSLFVIDRLNIPEGKYSVPTRKDLMIWFSIGSMYVLLTIYFAVVYPDYFAVSLIYFAMAIFALIIAPIFFYVLKWEYINLYSLTDLYWTLIGSSLLFVLVIFFSLFKIPASILPLPIFFILLFPVVEESMFRGVLFIQFLQVGFVFGLLAQSIIFALFHSYVYHGNIYYLTYLFLLGVILSYITYKSKSFLPAFIVHILNNLLAVI